MRRNKRSIGTWYEKKAGTYLEELGYQILEYNYRCHSGEIDIIARDGEYLVFCEVKYRSGTGSGHPLEAVDVPKQRTLSRCAFSYIAKHRITNLPCRFDVVGVMDHEVVLIKHAFEIGE